MTALRQPAGRKRAAARPGAAPAPIAVAPTGGRYRSLAEAVAAAGAGATITLPAGRHALPHGLALPRAVTLAGAGRDLTEVVAGAGEYVLCFTGPGRLELRDLTVRWTGDGAAPADVVSVRGGEVSIERCRFSGAPSTAEVSGAGLELTGAVAGRVADCELTGNGNGLVVAGAATPVLERLVCRANDRAGIVYDGHSGGLAHANRCEENGGSGILLADAAAPTLDGNVCRANRQSGITYTGRAAGLANRNDCAANAFHGIVVVGETQPALNDNYCHDNGQAGILFADAAAGLARRNTCAGNGQHGIALLDAAQPSLDGNVCQGNGGEPVADGRRGAAGAPAARPRPSVLYLLTNRAYALQFLPRGGVVAEIGVAKGEFSELLYQILQPAELHLIDPWLHQARDDYAADINNVGDEENEQRYQLVRRKFAPFANVHIHRDFSYAAVTRFPDQYFDFIYVDAMHTHDAVLQDLLLYAPKLKPHGLLGGHDFCDQPVARNVMGECGVVSAVAAFTARAGFHLIALTSEAFPSYFLAPAGGSPARDYFVQQAISSDAGVIELVDVDFDQYGQSLFQLSDGRYKVVPRF